MDKQRKTIYKRVAALAAVCVLILIVWAGLAGLRAEGLGSKTKWWFWPNAFVRECIGLLANRALPELIWLIILVVLFGGIATQVIW